MRKLFLSSITFGTILAAMASMQSCEKVNELPTINEGYETKYRMPDPTTLTDEDRQVISDQEDEYEKNAH
ncbi:MAG: hypothetical protein IJ209_01965 [Bacteroidaceae bacterium]|nr:hypothetical protein [Bacteroidaceae bacterium]